MVRETMEDQMGDELDRLDRRWPEATDANVESMAACLVGGFLGTTWALGRKAMEHAVNQGINDMWRDIATLAIEHLPYLTQPDQPAAEPMPVHADLSRGWTTQNAILQEYHWNASAQPAEPTPVLRDRSHDADEVAKFMRYARGGDPISDPAPKWRLREPGVMELVGTQATVTLSQFGHIRVYEGQQLHAEYLGSVKNAKRKAERLIANRRAFGLDV